MSLTTEVANVPDDTFYCDTVHSPSKKGDIFTTLKLKNGVGQLKVKVDTGAKCNVLAKHMLHDIDHTSSVNTEEKVSLVAYDGEKINTEGTAILDCM